MKEELGQESITLVMAGHVTQAHAEPKTYEYVVPRSIPTAGVEGLFIAGAPMIVSFCLAKIGGLSKYSKYAVYDCKRAFYERLCLFSQAEV